MKEFSERYHVDIQKLRTKIYYERQKVNILHEQRMKDVKMLE